MRFVLRGDRLYRLIGGRAFRVMRRRADWPALLGERAAPADPAAPAAYDGPAPRICWRCTAVAVRVWGVPCAPCAAELLDEYDAERRRSGRELLYLPDVPRPGAWPAALAPRRPDARRPDGLPGHDRPDAGRPLQRAPGRLADDGAPAPLDGRRPNLGHPRAPDAPPARPDAPDAPGAP